MSWTDKPEYEPAPPVHMNPWYTKATVCTCHGLVRVWKGGRWRCPVKFAATQHRYDISQKGKQKHRRMNQARKNRRVQISNHSIWMPTPALARVANALVKRRRSEWRSHVTRELSKS